MAKRGKSTGRRWAAGEARVVLEAWEESGQSMAAYARSIGVDAQRLSWWRKRLTESAAEVVPKAALIPVAVRGSLLPVGSAPVVVTTTTGVRIEVNAVEHETAAWVMTMLEGEERS